MRARKGASGHVRLRTRTARQCKGERNRGGGKKHQQRKK